jgi:LPS-assembly lipoprotein
MRWHLSRKSARPALLFSPLGLPLACKIASACALTIAPHLLDETPPMRPAASLRSPLLPLLGLLALAGCGFQLRVAATLPPAVNPMLIQGAPAHDLLRVEFENLLEQGGVVLTNQRGEARTILTIQDRKSDKRVLSVDQHGKVAEYELHESVRFRVTRPDGSELVPLQRATISRSYVNTGGEQALGKQAEELLLRDDMRRDLLAQVLRRLEAQLRNGTAAAAAAAGG